MSRSPRTVLLAGGTGYIGRAVAQELLARGHRVVAVVRERAGIGAALDAAATRRLLAGCEVRFAPVTDLDRLRSVLEDLPELDAVISCVASRTGVSQDAWRVDYRANRNLLAVGRAAGAGHFVLLSALCVQKPRLAFQQAKLAFEAELCRADLEHTVVRPTAFFKSLAGQVRRVQRGRPFLVFGSGQETACKPIGEGDLARFLADCLEDPTRRNRILPIGGPGPAITPREQGELLFELVGRPPRFRRLPASAFAAAAAALRPLGRAWSRAEATAELLRIAHYYATESMLVWDAVAGRYDAEATPSTGGETLRDFYTRILESGLAGQELGDQRLFGGES